MTAIVMILLWLPLALWQGWVLAILWGWLIVPIFHCPTLGAWPAAGVSLVAGYLTHQSTTDHPCDKRGEWEKVGRWVGFALVHPAFGLAFGWIIARLIT